MIYPSTRAHPPQTAEAAYFSVVGAAAPKDTNPKEIMGAAKLQLQLIPQSATAYLSLALYEGAAKYGAYNWRLAGVRAGTYVAATERHLHKWWNGEDVDPETKINHLANAMACLAILLDAKLCGKLNDDRPPSAPVGKLMEDLANIQKHIRELHKGKNPVHARQKGE